MSIPSAWRGPQPQPSGGRTIRWIVGGAICIVLALVAVGAILWR